MITRVFIFLLLMNLRDALMACSCFYPTGLPAKETIQSYHYVALVKIVKISTRSKKLNNREYNWDQLSFSELVKVWGKRPAHLGANSRNSSCFLGYRLGDTMLVFTSTNVFSKNYVLSCFYSQLYTYRYPFAYEKGTKILQHMLKLLKTPDSTKQTLNPAAQRPKPGNQEYRKNGQIHNFSLFAILLDPQSRRKRRRLGCKCTKLGTLTAG